jgi:hypothetical protein
MLATTDVNELPPMPYHQCRYDADEITAFRVSLLASRWYSTSICHHSKTKSSDAVEIAGRRWIEVRSDGPDVVGGGDAQVIEER